MKYNKYFQQIVLPKLNSHKGENGRVLVIGGSKLFHAASFWAASAASKIVDMVHFSSPTFENNELMRVRAKAKFWEGIVVPWEEVNHYIEEDDAILIGPGMERGEETRIIVNKLLAKYPVKRWVIDGGALQEVDINLIKENMIVTPNRKEWEIIKARGWKGQATALVKGVVDKVMSKGEVVEIAGGNAGMTKGGTGDVLAGILVGLDAKSPALPASVTASYINKRGGENLAKRLGYFYGAGELIPELQKILGQLFDENKE